MFNCSSNKSWCDRVIAIYPVALAKVLISLLVNFSSFLPLQPSLSPLLSHNVSQCFTHPYVVIMSGITSCCLSQLSVVGGWSFKSRSCRYVFETHSCTAHHFPITTTIWRLFQRIQPLHSKGTRLYLMWLPSECWLIFWGQGFPIVSHYLPLQAVL